MLSSRALLRALPSRVARANRPFQTSSFARFPSSTAAEIPSPTPKKAPSATTLFYRQLVPSMLHCLALGSIVYYALELLHSTLDGELVVEELQLQVEVLQEELNLLKKDEDSINTVENKQRKGWLW